MTATGTSRSPFVRALLRPGAVFGVGWLVLVAIASFGAPALAPYDPLETSFGESLQVPSAAHLLGTDSLGRDILSRLMYGGSDAIAGTLIAVATAVLLGVSVGVVAGYYGRWFDAIASRANEVLITLPAIVILLVVVGVFGRNFVLTMAALGLILAGSFFRLAQGAASAVRNELFIDASRVAGVHSLRIVIGHVLPNISRPVIVQATLAASIALLAQAGLAFLGLGQAPPAPQWGSMITEATAQLNISPWMMVPTGAAVILTALAFNGLGDALSSGIEGGRIERHIPRAGRRRPVRQASPATSGLDRPLLEVAGLRVATVDDDVTLVDDVSLSVDRGETLALVGESGCGKTLTALAVSGLLPSSLHVVAGTVRFDGIDVTDSEDPRWQGLRGRRIAFVSQEPVNSLDPSYSVGDQLAEPMRVHLRLSRRQARLRSIQLLEAVGIARAADVAKSYPHELSGGMAQRVCIAIALSCDPELIIADEPTTALDVTIQAEILDLLRDVQSRTGVGLIVVTHDWGVVADVADRVLVMYAGEVIEESPSQSIFDTPQHPYTAALLASKPRATTSDRLPTIPGNVPPPGAWPTGCRFANRCAFATPDCSASAIGLVQLGDERTSRCIHIERIQTPAIDSEVA